MPQLIFLAAIGAGVYVGMKVLAKVVEQAAGGATTGSSEGRTGGGEAAGSERDLGRLEYDPQSGVYRPDPRS